MNSTVRNVLAAGAGAAAALAIALPLLPAGGATATPAGTTELAAQMDGQQEVPPADANGVGDAFVFGTSSDPQTLCYAVIVDRMGTPLAAHIHHGAVGVENPPAVPLKTPKDGDSAGCVQVRARLVSRILNNPQNWYVNVHNAKFPDGAIRGQLAAR
jgi:CHRD domain